MVFEAVQILISLAAHLASVRLLLLHADGTGIWYGREGIDDGEGAVFVLLQLLILMAVLTLH